MQSKNNPAIQALLDIKRAQQEIQSLLAQDRIANGGANNPNLIIHLLQTQINMCVGLHIELLCREAGLSKEDFMNLQEEEEKPSIIVGVH